MKNYYKIQKLITKADNSLKFQREHSEHVSVVCRSFKYYSRAISNKNPYKAIIKTEKTNFGPKKYSLNVFFDNLMYVYSKGSVKVVLYDDDYTLIPDSDEGTVIFDSSTMDKQDYFNSSINNNLVLSYEEMMRLYDFININKKLHHKYISVYLNGIYTILRY